MCGITRPDGYISLNNINDILGYELMPGTSTERAIRGIKYKQEKKEFVESGSRTVNPIYVSVGHKISLCSSVNIVKELILNGNTIPEPLRLADFYSKTFMRGSAS
jgi:deoxyinosine 3'endonuclease (endonuclease V)